MAFARPWFALLLAAVAWAMVAPARAVEPAQAAAEGIDAIAWDLVRAAGAGNVVVSPASIWEALAMTHQGARGETAAEIAGVLGLPDDRSAIAEAAAALRTSFAEAKGKAITLDVANRLWTQRGTPLEREFVTTLERRFGAGAGVVDFSATPEAARGTINEWVAGHTAKKIPELLKAGVITPLTRLVLTNAVYLKAPWVGRPAVRLGDRRSRDRRGAVRRHRPGPTRVTTMLKPLMRWSRPTAAVCGPACPSSPRTPGGWLRLIWYSHDRDA